MNVFFKEKLYHGWMSKIDWFFRLISPKEMYHLVKLSTFVHLFILLSILILPLFLSPHKKFKNMSGVYSVNLVSIPGNIKTPPIATTKPAKKPEPRRKVTPIKIPEITLPQPLKTPTLQEKLQEKLKIEQENKEWQEPKEIEIQNPKSKIQNPRPVTASMEGFEGSSSPFDYYLSIIQNKISSCWTEPKTALDKQYNALVSFILKSNGNIIGVNIKRSSGIKNLDESALKAIELAKPFPELPPGYTDSELTINVEFNLD